jgi:hypothetical protein
MLTGNLYYTKMILNWLLPCKNLVNGENNVKIRKCENVQMEIQYRANKLLLSFIAAQVRFAAHGPRFSIQVVGDA